MHSHSHAACIYQLDSFLFYLQGLTHASLYSNQLLHQPAFTNTLLHQSLFAETHFNTNQLQTCFYTTRFSADHLLHQPALFDQPPFTQTRFCTNHQITCFQCLQLNDQRTSTVNLLTLSLLSLLSLLRLAFGGGCLRKRLSLDQTELISWATWRFARSMNSWKILKGI